MKFTRAAAVLGTLAFGCAFSAPAMASAPSSAGSDGTGMTGRIVVQPDGTIYGTLPPGKTKLAPPESPARPGEVSVAERIRNAPASKTTGLREAPEMVPGEVVDTTTSENLAARAIDPRPNDGCAYEKHTFDGHFIMFWGVATRCSRGNLSVKSWLEAEVTGTRHGDSKACDGSTGCSLVNAKVGWETGGVTQRAINYFDVKNYSTGGYSIAWGVEFARGDL